MCQLATLVHICFRRETADTSCCELCRYSMSVVTALLFFPEFGDFKLEGSEVGNALFLPSTSACDGPLMSMPLVDPSAWQGRTVLVMA